MSTEVSETNEAETSPSSWIRLKQRFFKAQNQFTHCHPEENRALSVL